MKLSTLIDTYLDSRHFKKLSVNSQIMYKQMISTLYMVCEHHSQTDVVSIDAKEADRIYAKILQNNGVHRAVHVVKVARRIWNIGLRYKLVGHNPWVHMDLDRCATRDTLIPYADVHKLIHYDGNEGHYKPLCALIALCYYLAQRPSDMKNLKTGNFYVERGEAKVAFMQKKTGKGICMTVPKELSSFLQTYAYGLHNSDYIVGYKSDTAWHNQWQQLKFLTGVDMKYQLRDLRRTALDEAANGGATDQELRSLSGHSDNTPVLQRHYLVSKGKHADNAQKKRKNKDILVL